MKIVYVQTAYSANDLVGSWFSATRDMCRASGGDAWMFVKYTHRPIQPEDNMIGNSLSCGIHNRIFEYTGLQDMFSYVATKKFLKQLDFIKPDIIHCHVINDQFLHLGLFCNYVNEHNIKVIWTFHDARALTGQCPYPNYAGCEQWKNQCNHCPNENRMISPSKEWLNCVGIVQSYRRKQICSIKRLIVVTPSNWLAFLVGQSYLKSTKCVVIHNGINGDIFHPVKSSIRTKYQIPLDDKLLLAVGNPISTLKGREYLHRLATELPVGYTLAMIGCKAEDVTVFASHKKVLAFPRIPKSELIEFYSSSDLLVNPTLADNFPTVNLEAQNCGCPVVAFDSDGTPETVAPKGKVVHRKNYEAWKEAILNFDYDGAREDAVFFAQQFSKEKCMKQYFNLYKEIMQDE